MQEISPDILQDSQVHRSGSKGHSKPPGHKTEAGVGALEKLNKEKIPQVIRIWPCFFYSGHDLGMLGVQQSVVAFGFSWATESGDKVVNIKSGFFLFPSFPTLILCWKTSPKFQRLSGHCFGDFPEFSGMSSPHSNILTVWVNSLSFGETHLNRIEQLA